MELIFNKAELLDVISKFNRISSGKSNSALGMTLFEINKNEVTISATNIRISVSTTLLTNNLNDECGTFTVETAMLLNCINKLSGTIKITLDEQSKLTISSGRAKYTFTANDSSDFPEMQKVEGDTVEFKASNFVKGISSTLYCVAESSENLQRKECSCINITAESDMLSFKAMDGYRLTEYNISINYSGEPFYAFIPKKSAKFVLDIASKFKDETIKITKSNTHALFVIGDYKITTNTMTADNFDFDIVKNKEIETIITVKSEDLCLAIEQAIPVIENQSKNPLRFNVINGLATISSVSSLGKSNSECNISMEGKAIRLGVNSKYMLDAVKNLKSDEIVLKLQSPIKPIEIYNSKNNDNWAIIMPMRLDDAA